MKLFATIALLLPTIAFAQAPAQDDAPQATITVRSNLVVVPALVKTKSGELIYTLKPEDFILTDDGVPQRLKLDPDTGSQPLALVICVETGGDGALHLHDYTGLSTMLDNLLGSVEHKVAIVGFDAKPVLLHGFTPNTAFIEHSLNELDPGDPMDLNTKQAAILDALVYSVDILRQQPPTYRRAILLLSETLDHGSHTTLIQAVRAIGDSNTSVYTIGFTSTKVETLKEAAKLNSDEPGPEHGCFTRDLDEDGNPIPPKDALGHPESRATQNFDCFAQLLPPLRLAKIAEIATRNAFRKNVSSSVARLTGGEHFKFKDVKTLDRDLFTLSNHIPNRYTLTFHPQSPHPGFHVISLQLTRYPNLHVESRNGYWVEDTPNKP